jgi:hypothetical protein
MEAVSTLSKLRVEKRRELLRLVAERGSGLGRIASRASSESEPLSVSGSDARLANRWLAGFADTGGKAY